MGVALIGVGTALGFPTAMTAGAVVSGAYFGDKMSPLSDTTNLAPAMAGATLFDHIKHMIYTTGVSMIIALVAYAVMGFMYASDNEVDMSVVQEITEFIEGSTNISVWALIPPLFVILMVAFKLPAIPGLIGGVLIGIPFMFLNQAHVEAAIERAGDLPLGSGLINNIFYILNNGIAMGNVPEGASDIINELSALLTVVSYFCFRSMKSILAKAENKKVAMYLTLCTVFLAVLCIIVTLSIVGSRTAFNPFRKDKEIYVIFWIALNAMNMVLVWTSCKTNKTGENRAETVEERIDRLASERGLSSREREIAFLLYKGKTNNEIADMLFLSSNTIKVHTSNLYRKLGVSTRMQAVGVVRGEDDDD